MAHDRDAALDHVVDGFGHGRAALDLHRLGARLLHDPGGVVIGRLGAAFVGAEGHVDDDHGLARPTHHRLTMQDHHLHGHADGVGQAMNHHAEAVADQQQVAVVVENLGDRGGIGGEADNGIAALAGGDVRRRETPDRFLTMGRQR
jgi:hypothetical protein